MRSKKSIFSIMLVFSMIINVVISPFVFVTPAQAATMPSAIIDNFEDGDASNWFFFSGNSAGGGGGRLRSPARKNSSAAVLSEKISG